MQVSAPEKLLKTQTEAQHGSVIVLSLFALSTIVRIGNVLLSKKIDQLEEVAERLLHEKWELYAIKVGQSTDQDSVVTRSTS